MEKSLIESLKYRRSYYALTDKNPAGDAKIEEIINQVIKYTPSAFNSQSTRMVLLLNNHHKELWNIVLQSIKPLISATAFAKSKAKIEGSFASGHGTILFFEAESIVKDMEEKFPLYKDNFKIWSQQTSAMHQLMTWCLIEELGLGASLQHYNPLIDSEVHKRWNIPASWNLVAQMPFGVATDAPGEKLMLPVEERVKVFK